MVFILLNFYFITMVLDSSHDLFLVILDDAIHILSLSYSSLIRACYAIR